MPRANNIYIVSDDYPYEGSFIRAAFTVKYELIQWLKDPRNVDPVTVVYRTRDGHRNTGEADFLGTAEEVIKSE